FVDTDRESRRRGRVSVSQWRLRAHVFPLPERTRPFPTRPHPFFWLWSRRPHPRWRVSCLRARPPTIAPTPRPPPHGVGARGPVSTSPAYPPTNIHSPV